MSAMSMFLLQAYIALGVTHGPNERENSIVTQKRKATPAILRGRFEPSVFWLLMAASQISAIVMALMPTMRGFLRPKRSMKKVMKIRSSGELVSFISRKRHAGEKAGRTYW